MAKKKYAEGCTIGPGETLAPDLRRIPLKGTNDLVIVRLKLPLRDGDFAVLVGEQGVRVGRYYSGPPRRFAEYADPWKTEGLGKPLRSLPATPCCTGQ